MDLMKNFRIAGVIGLLAAIPIHVSAADYFNRCVPYVDVFSTMDQSEEGAAEHNQKLKDEAQAKCDVENRIYDQWEPEIRKLQQSADTAYAAAQAQDWPKYQTILNDVRPTIDKFRTLASENPKLPEAQNLSSLYGPDITYMTQNAGLGTSSNLDDAIEKISAGLNTPNAQQAAGAGVNLIRQTEVRVAPVVKMLVRQAKANLAEVRVESAAQENRETANKVMSQSQKLRGDTVESYFGGFGTRLAKVITPWFLVLCIVVAGGVWLGNKRRQNPIVSGAAAALSYALPGTLMALVFVVLPFLPMWLVMLATVIASIAMFYFAGRVFGWLADKIGQNKAARWLRILGGTIDNLRKGMESPVQTDAATQMAASKATHGSARWGTVAEIEANNHFGSGGFTLARVPDAPKGVDPRFRFTGHVVTVAPTGSGKGIGSVMPNLLEYKGSALVLDVKGENAAVTARARRAMGHKVYVIDPFNVTEGEKHAFNVLDRINPNDPDCVSETAVLADSLVISGGKDADAHFDESAKTLLQGFMLYVAGLSDPTKRTLGELRELLTADEDTFLGILTGMALDEDYAYGIAARAANTIIGMSDRERSSVVSTARRSTAFLDDPRIAEALSRSDFNLANIKSELMTVYLVMPMNKIGPNSRFIRAFVNNVMAAITASPKKPQENVAFFLDEFGQLGYMKSIEDAVSLLRGYGLSFWVYVQELSQLKNVYPRWQTFLANSAKVFFGVDDLDTAKYVSETLGKSTIEYETQNAGRNSGNSLSGGGASLSGGRSTGSSQQMAGRDLLTPDEVMQLGPTRPIVLVRGERPYQLVRMNYLTDAEFVGLADPNPYHS
ncbi:type IV secretory system conjugative DNA transfer family protein (plasmid) [Pseudomonas luteola]